MKGLRKARIAVQFVYAKSASAKETEMDALLMTPMRWGGLSLPPGTRQRADCAFGGGGAASHGAIGWYATFCGRRPALRRSTTALPFMAGDISRRVIPGAATPSSPMASML